MRLPTSLAGRQFYALVWKDFVVHKRHYIWTALEIVIPVLVCAMAILSNSHQGKPKLEDEKTFDPDDFERLYGDLNPSRHTLFVAPNSSFTRALVGQVDDGAVNIKLVDTETELVETLKREIPVSLDQVKRLLPDTNANVTIGGVLVETDVSLLAHQERPSASSFVRVISKLDGQPMHIPLHLSLAIRAKDFRLGPEPFPKKYSLGPYIHSDHYIATFFMASQVMLSRAYINLLATYTNVSSGAELSLPTNADIIGQRLPYPKYVAHKRLKETTLGTFVAGSQKQKPFVLTMDYCITVGFLVTAIFLAKRIVDERKSRVRDMLRLVGISDWIYYGSHLTNTMLIMLIQCGLITLLFTGHPEAPAQNVDSSLLFTILVLYSGASIIFVLFLSTLFSSSTKAIIFTSLLWLGLPEALDRIFKMDSGVIESNGFLAVDEYFHLSFCLVPNFALRLMNRLLTECDIYGEFYAKKQLYGEYRAIWPNVAQVLPLYKSISVFHIMFAMLLSMPVYMVLIYWVNSMAASSSLSLASLGAAEGSESRSVSPWPVRLIVGMAKFLLILVVAPFKLIYKLLAAHESDSEHQTTTPVSWSGANLQQQNMLIGAQKPPGGYVNAAFGAPDELACKIELNSLSEKQREAQAVQSGGYFEPSPRMLSAGVSVRNLAKSYSVANSELRRIDAVKNVSLDMFYSQILVLLGHNGAGKTTLIDIISGHKQKSAGQVLIDSHSIDTNPREARRQLGFCPQFDVLFQRLTVEEHLYFYGLVKGARGGLKAEIEQLLRQSGLHTHRRKLSKALSGGYKRKLSLAIAMVAGSKVLILDEPTSGMDPESRRKVWDFLQLIKHDRLILMTTHHMEEADALGDRIAVMSAGQVKCCGSALFLKRVFNAGYHLRISKGDTWSQTAFDQLVASPFKLADKLENATPHELMFTFDAAETASTLPQLFDALEATRDQVGIFGFGLTVATMDDVFMKIGLHFKEVEAEEMESKFRRDQRQLEAAPKSFVRPRLTGNSLNRQHLRALLAKRYQHARNNWFQLLWILTVSLACVASVVLLIELVIFREELTPEWSREMTLEGAGYGHLTQGVYQFATEAPPEDLEALRAAAFPGTEPTTSSTAAPSTVSTPPASRPTRQATSRLVEGAQSSSLNDSALFLQNYWLQEARASGMQDLLTYTDINTQMIDLLTRQFANFREHYVIGAEKAGPKYVVWYNGEATHSFPVAMNVMLNSILKQFTDLSAGSDPHPFKGSRISLRHVAMAQINTLIAFLPHLGRLINLVFLPFSLAFITSYFVIFPTHERVTKSKHLQLMTGVSIRTFWLAHFLFDLLLYSIYTALVLAIYFVWDKLLNERQIYFANLEHTAALVLLVSFFSLAALPLAYTFSFVAKKPTSAFSSFCVLTILTGTATLTLVSLYELKYEHTASASLKLAFTAFLCLARLVPSVSLLVGLQKLFALNTTRSICINVSPEVLELLCRYINSPIVDDELRVLRPERCCKQVCQDECFDQWPFFWSGWFGINVELAMLLLDALLFWLLLALIESPSLRRRLSCCLWPDWMRRLTAGWAWQAWARKLAGAYNWRVPRTYKSQETSAKEVEVERERARNAIQLPAQSDQALVVSELSKVYRANKFRAVDRLSFVLGRQEFFGLLGVNGAGKSTTFGMLTGSLVPTSGTARLGPYELSEKRRDYLARVGYCPQQDALLDSLSGEQMLTLFARLRGLPEEYCGEAVAETLSRLGLAKIAQVNCNNYSGGNKRRLSVAMALIGAPELVFLDEPTSGVDPRSRRRLWATLADFQRQTQSSIVMTSHSMNECECLCDRVAIMAGGQFHLLGSVQYLRTKLARGFSLVLKLKPQALDRKEDLTLVSQQIHQYMLASLGALAEVQLKEVHQTVMQYHVQPKEQLTWSRMLTLLEQAKRELELEDYQVTSDASLESIFLSLAKQQEQRQQQQTS